MKYSWYFLMLLFAVLPVEGVRYSDPLKLVMDGLDDYERKGSKKAIDTWGVDSSHVIAEVLMNSEKKLGKIKKYDIPERVDVSTHSVIIHSIVNYEYGPLFIEFHLYNSTDGWIILDISTLGMEKYLEKRTLRENARNLDEMVLLQRGMGSLLSEQCKMNASNTDSLLKTVNRLTDNVRVLSEMIGNQTNSGVKK